MIRSVLTLLALSLLVSACVGGGSAPTASAERAAALATRGDHEASAREYQTLASLTRGSTALSRNEYRLLAIEQWLLASNVEAAGVLIDSLEQPLEQPLDQAQSIRLDLLRIESEFLAGRTEQAWQQMAGRAEPLDNALLERHHALRQRIALAVGRPLEALRSERTRERAAGEDVQRIASLRTELLTQLREVSARGSRLDPRSAADDKVARGWLEAAPLAARAASLPASANRGITAAWQRRYPQHPATAALLATSSTALQEAREASREPPPSGRTPSTTAIAPNPRGTKTGHIAALLPLSGRLAAAGEEIREGLISAYLTQPALASQPLRFYDSAARPIEQLITEAIDQGALFIVGPLLREEVLAAAKIDRRVPILALNSLPDPLPEGSLLGGAPLYQFALAPEDEARAVAARALAEGRRRAVTFVPAGEWGERVLQAFRSRFEAGGGRILAASTLSGSEFTAGIDSALRIDDSRARHRRLQSVLNQPLAFQPRRRSDVDLLFAPGQAAFVEALRLQLKLKGAADLPTFTTAEGWDGEPAPELEGLIFPDMPWRITTDVGMAATLRTMTADAERASAPRGRLFAFGHDAWLLQDALRRADPAALAIDGVTGRLTLSEDRRVLRSLQFVDIHDGQPRLLPDP